MALLSTSASRPAELARWLLAGDFRSAFGPANAHARYSAGAVRAIPQERPTGRSERCRRRFTAPGEGEQIGGPTAVTIKATGEETNRSLYLGEAVVAPGFAGPPPHTHERLHDMFYVLDGTLTMLLGDQTSELSAGSFVCVPAGVIHTFSNPSEAPVRFLNFNTPAGWENYMRDLGAALAKGTPSREELGQIASRYDFQVA